jgi:histidinol-phosphatase
MKFVSTTVAGAAPELLNYSIHRLPMMAFTCAIAITCRSAQGRAEASGCQANRFVDDSIARKLPAMATHSPFLATALDAARAGAEVIRRYYQKNLAVTVKSDKSPVTQADVETEQVIRRIIAEKFPAHGFYGEETGSSGIDNEYLWLVDPIDGTKAFVREYPMFSTQIALMHKGKLIVGVSSAPVYGEVAYAELGKGAWLNAKPINVSTIDSIEGSAISGGNLKSLALSDRWSKYGALLARAHRIRGYGDFLHYHLLAAGKIDIVIESDVNILDIAALTVIVEAAGGKFTQLDGAAVNLKTTTVLASNGKLHAATLAALR